MHLPFEGIIFGVCWRRNWIYPKFALWTKIILASGGNIKYCKSTVKPTMMWRRLWRGIERMKMKARKVQLLLTSEVYSSCDAYNMFRYSIIEI